jgi:hypothetical protein
MAYTFLKISTIGSHNSLESVDGGMEFLMATARTLQNDRVCARQKENIPVELCTVFRRQKPPSVMVWVGMTMDRSRHLWSSLRRVSRLTRLSICTC